MAEYLVTGGAGFIGSHIVHALAARGKSVRVFDNLETGSLANLEAVRDRIEWVQGDLRDAAAIERAVHGVRYVLHQAALASVPRSVDDPLTTDAVNVGGSLRLLAAARAAGVRRLVFASSSSIYGDSPSLPKVESMPANPLSPYALQKLAGETYFCLFHRLYGLETIALRYFNVFGPRQNPQSQYAAVIPLFITRLLRGARPIVYGDGEQTRDFSYVENVVEANLRALAAGPRAVGRVYNIACGERIGLNQLLGLIGDELGVRPDPIYAEPRPGDVRHSLADISAAREALGYAPAIGASEGLRRTIAFYRNAVEAGTPIAAPASS